MNQLSPSQSDQLKEIGTYLKQQRLAQSLSLEEIAAITMIRLPILRALEESDFNELPELIYVKGFIRRYGEALGMDGPALAARITNIEPPPISEALAPSVGNSPPMDYQISKAYRFEEGEKSRTFPWWVWLLGGLGLLSGLAYWLLRPVTPRAEPPVVTIQPTPTPSPVLTTPVKPSPSPSPSLIAPLSLQVKLKEEAWLKITVDGKVVHEGILAAGTEKNWQGKQLIVMRSGSAGAVTYSLNQQSPKSFGKLGEVKEITFTPTTVP